MTVARIRTLAVTAVAAGLVLATACSSSSETTTTSTSAAGGTTSTARSSGTSVPGTAPGTTVPGAITDPSVPIEATVGEEFTITVASNPTTGYTWTVTGEPADSIAVPVGEPTSTAGSMPGEGGTETFTFKASGPGTTTITLTYARSFAPEDDPTVQEYTLVVTA